MALITLIDAREVCTQWGAAQGWQQRGQTRPAPPLFGVERVVTQFESDQPAAALLNLMRDRAPHTLDWLVTPAQPAAPRLLVSDMDSTIINIECIDALAARHGVGQQVADITNRAMAGELDFEASLRARVASLKDCPLAHIQAVIVEELRLNRGAGEMISALKSYGAHCLLVSGGFTLFAHHVATEAGFDAAHANTLSVADDALTGGLEGALIDATAKADILTRAADRLGIAHTETLALGDGANDIAMAEAAGLAIGYRPRDALKAVVDGVIHSGDLRSVALFFA